MKTAFYTVVAVLMATAAAAQALPTSYRVEVVAAGTANPLTAPVVANGTLTLPYNAADCGKPLFPTVPADPEVNPTTFVWGDPASANLLCLSPQVVFLNGLARAGTATTAAYVFRLVAINGTVSVMSDSASNGFSLIAVAQPPTLASFTPLSGNAGTVITLTGTNFTGATAVRFNGLTAVFTVVSATSITATVPTGSTAGKISVVTPVGTVTSVADFNAPGSPRGIQVRP